MNEPTGLFAKKSMRFVIGTFFTLVKMLFVIVVLTGGALLAGQSSVSPVSMRLLTSYGMEYAIATFKPYRHFFPRPYLIDLEKK